MMYAKMPDMFALAAISIVSIILIFASIKIILKYDGVYAKNL